MSVCPQENSFCYHMTRFKPTSNLCMMMDMLTGIIEAKISLCVTDREDTAPFILNLLDPDFFLVLAHPVYKMRIIQEPNTIEL